MKETTRRRKLLEKCVKNATAQVSRVLFTINWLPVAKAADLGDDLAYYHPSSVFANKFSQSGDVFVYSFEYNYTAPKFTWKSVIVSPQHADDLVYFIHFTNESDLEILHVGRL